jgi:hypothetical protein
MQSNHAFDELQLLFIWKNCQRDLEKWLGGSRASEYLSCYGPT